MSLIDTYPHIGASLLYQNKLEYGSDKMISCPQCNSIKTKVLPLKVRDVKEGKTRKRECLDCTFQFITLERMYVLPELPKPAPKAKPKTKRKKFSARGKRILTPKPRPEPDFDSMTDEEIEAWIFEEY